MEEAWTLGLWQDSLEDEQKKFRNLVREFSYQAYTLSMAVRNMKAHVDEEMKAVVETTPAEERTGHGGGNSSACPEKK